MRVEEPKITGTVKDVEQAGEMKTQVFSVCFVWLHVHLTTQNLHSYNNKDKQRHSVTFVRCQSRDGVVQEDQSRVQKVPHQINTWCTTESHLSKHTCSTAERNFHMWTEVNSWCAACSPWAEHTWPLHRCRLELQPLRFSEVYLHGTLTNKVVRQSLNVRHHSQIFFFILSSPPWYPIQST